MSKSYLHHLSGGVDRKLNGPRRLMFFTFAVLFCGTCMVYYMYATFPYGLPSFADFTLISPNDRLKKPTTTMKVLTETSIMKHAKSKLPTQYDLNTYGLKLFDCYGNSAMASFKYSKMTSLFHHYTENLFYVTVHLYDDNQVIRHSGGDVIVMWAEQLDEDGRVSGHVTDNRNGSYTGKFKIFWTGKTLFKAKIASTIENQCLRSNALYRYGNTVYAKQRGWGIYSVFKHKDNTYKTKCGANPQIYHSDQLCNFTTMNANISWFCGAPPNGTHLNCTHINHFTVGVFDTTQIPSHEKMTNYGHGVVVDALNFNVRRRYESNSSVKCYKYPTSKSWTSSVPTGYWAGSRWNIIHCNNSAMQFSSKAYQKCLEDKYFAVIGDSTARHYTEYVLKNVFKIGEVNLKDGLGPGPKRSYQVHEEYKRFNITVTYSKHEFPFHNIDFPPYNITSMPLEIRRLETAPVAGHNLIVLLHYNQHLQAYPIEQFHLRIRLLIPAIKRLIKVKPGVKIFFKGPHMTIDDVRWFDPRISLIYMDILHKEFDELRDHVTYLDTWSITVAHNSQLPHPGGNAFLSHIHQLMSYICKY